MDLEIGQALPPGMVKPFPGRAPGILGATACILLAMIPFSARADRIKGFVKTSGTLILDGEGRELRLRGPNLGGWLLWESYIIRYGGPETTESRMKRAIIGAVGEKDAFKFFRELRGSQLARADIRRISRLGFNCVRLPFNANILSPEGHFDMNPGEGWRLLDQAVDWCEQEGVYVILDMHSAPGGQNGGGISDTELAAGLWVGPDKQGLWRRTADIWREIASRYRNRPVVAAYNLMNEPVMPKDADKKELADLSRMIIKAVREVDTEHMIMVEGDGYSTDFSMFTGENMDSNLCYQFHKYWNDTTHASIKNYLDLRSNQNAPIWLGEFGENSPRWYARCVELMEEHGIGWCFWPYKRTQRGCIEAAAVPETWIRAARVLCGLDPPETLSRKKILAGLKDLAKAFKLGNCTQDTEAVRALKGFWEQIFRVPGPVPAAEYDRCSLARQGNAGGALRAGDADIYEDGAGGYVIRNLQRGDTLEFAVKIVAKDEIKVSLINSSGSFETTLDGKPLPSEGMRVGRGRHRVRVTSLQDGSSLGTIFFSASPGRIEAEDFLPGEGEGYHDRDASDRGKAGRQAEGVDVEPDGEGGKNVGWIEDGEWLSYKVVSPRDGKFELLITASAPEEGGLFRISMDGKVVADDIQVPRTGGWNDWKEITLRNLGLPAGEHVMRLDAVKGGFDLDYFLFLPR